jgi:hypothetical protein
MKSQDNMVADAVNDKKSASTLGVSHWYGPFRPRLILVIATFLAVFIALPPLGAPVGLTCWRTESGSVSCNATLAGSRTTRGFEARAVELAPVARKGGLSPDHFQIVLTDEVGRQLKLWSMDIDEAQGPLAELDALLHQGGNKPFRIGYSESARTNWGILGIAFLGLVLIWLLWEVSPLWLHFNPSTRVLSVVPTWLGVPLAIKTYNLTGASEVRVNELPRALSSQRAPESGYRVTCTVGDRLINIPRGLRPAGNSHQDLVDWLRAVLGLQIANLPESESLPQPESESLPEPESLAPLPPQQPSSPPSQRVVPVAGQWLDFLPSSNLRRKIAYGLGVLTIGAIVLGGVFLYINATEGTLEVTCAHRCRFQGTDCFPGGEFQLTLAPGRYVIDIWRPELKSSWEPHAIDIVVGQTVRFTCR